jgi:hypothetical protein
MKYDMIDLQRAIAVSNQKLENMNNPYYWSFIYYLMILKRYSKQNNQTLVFK